MQSLRLLILLWRSVVGSYVLAIAGVVVAFWLRWLLDPLLGNHVPYATFVVAVVFSAWLGRAPAVAALLSGMVAAWYFFVPPRRSFQLADAEQWFNLSMYLFVGISIIGLSEMLRREGRRRRIAEAEFFENAAVGLHCVAADGTILRANRAELEMLGYAAEEYVGRNIVEFHADREVIDDILRRLTAGETLLDYEARLRAKDGSIRHVLMSSNVLRRDGQFVHTRCFTRDITDRKRAVMALHASEERLRLALDAGRMGTWDWDMAADTVDWSPGLEVIHGQPPGTFAGVFEAYKSNIHPEDRRQVLRALAAIRHSEEIGATQLLEYRVLWPDGSLHWVEGRGKLFKNDRGEPTRMIGVCQDVTRRKQLEEQLRRRMEDAAEAESRLRSALDNVVDGIITIDEDGAVQTINPAAERLFGYSASEVIGQNIKMLCADPYCGEHDEYLANYRRTGQARIIGIGREVEGRRRDGSTFPMYLAVGEYYRGSRRFFTGVVRDVTQLKRAEQSARFLADASIALAALVDHESTLQRLARLAVPVFADWCVVYLSVDDDRVYRTAMAHADPRQAELLAELDAKYPADRYAPPALVRVLSSGKPERASEVTAADLEAAALDAEHARLLTALGPKSYIFVPLLGRQRMFGAIAFAVSEESRRYTADDVALAEEIARRAAVALENAELYRALRDADRRKDEFLAMLAHELRNPLAPILNALDLLDAPDISSDAAGWARAMMKRQVEHMVRLIDDLLDVSRIMRGRIELRCEAVELAAIVERAVETTRPLIDSQRHRFVCELPSEPIWLDADPVRLSQVIANLLNNAAKYTEPEGNIRLSARQEGNQAVIRVRDDGTGIVPDLLPHVFDLFTQSERSIDRSQGGLGIGLSVVRSLVEMHGGTVAAVSEGLGHGSEFVVTLPLLASPDDATAAPREVTPRTAEPGSSPRRILVVDDTPGSAKLLAALLERLLGHEVRMAFDGPSALVAAREFRPDAVFLDIGLPGMSGYEVAAQLRSQPEFAGTMLIALTGYGADEDRRRSRAAGFDHHLVKPASAESLRRVLARARFPA